MDVAAMRDDSSGAEPAGVVDDYEWVNVWATQAADSGPAERQIAPWPQAAAEPSAAEAAAVSKPPGPPGLSAEMLAPYFSR